MVDDEPPMKRLLHPSFQKIWDQSGSGYYWYATRIGMGSVFYLSSTRVFPYNPDPERASTPYHDFYDILRAVEQGYVRKLEDGVAFQSGKKVESNA